MKNIECIFGWRTRFQYSIGEQGFKWIYYGFTISKLKKKSIWFIKIISIKINYLIIYIYIYLKQQFLLRTYKKI